MAASSEPGDAISEFREILLNPRRFTADELATRVQKGLFALGWYTPWATTLARIQTDPAYREQLLEEVDAHLSQLQQQQALAIDNPRRFVAVMKLRFLLTNYQRYLADLPGLEAQLRLQPQLSYPESETFSRALVADVASRRRILTRIEASLQAWRQANQGVLSRQLVMDATVAAEIKADLIAGRVPNAEIQALLLIPENVIKLAELLGLGSKSVNNLEKFLKIFNNWYYTPQCSEYESVLQCRYKAALYDDVATFNRLLADPELLDIDLIQALKASIPRLPGSVTFDGPGSQRIFDQLWARPDLQAVISHNQENYIRIPDSRAGLSPKEDLSLGSLAEVAIKANNWAAFELFYQDSRLNAEEVATAFRGCVSGIDPAFLEQLWETSLGRFSIHSIRNWIRFDPRIRAAVADYLPALEQLPPETRLGEVAASLGLDLDTLDQRHLLIPERAVGPALEEVTKSYRLTGSLSRETPRIDLIEKILSFVDADHIIAGNHMYYAIQNLAKQDLPELLELIVPYADSETLGEALAWVQRQPNPNSQIVNILENQIAQAE